MNLTKTGRFHAVIGGALLLAAAAVSPFPARGEEPPPDCPQCNAAERAIPFWSKIPYVSRLFKNVGQQEFERIGVDFDIEVCQACPTTTPLFMVRRTAHGQIAAPCCENEPCCGKDYEESSACCRASCETAKHGGPSWEQIVELTAENAALEATLEAQTAFHKEKSELFEMFAEVSMEKAKLEAKVESQAQHIELTKEMLTLVSENARLKAQVEMAEAKVALVHEMAKLALENEQLKLALKSRSGSGQLADDAQPADKNAAQYLHPSPEAKPSRAGPAKKASFHDADPSPRRPAALEQ